MVLPVPVGAWQNSRKPPFPASRPALQARYTSPARARWPGR